VTAEASAVTTILRLGFACMIGTVSTANVRVDAANADRL
jgi:hypothetical protein